jgi:hypothetical protein
MRVLKPEKRTRAKPKVANTKAGKDTKAKSIVANHIVKNLSPNQIPITNPKANKILSFNSY